MDGLRTLRLTLRRWRDADRDVFHRLNVDPAIMRFFAFRLSRDDSDALMDRWNDGDLANGMSFLALERRSDGEVIGMLGLAPVVETIYDFAPTVQIGWRLLPDARGMGYATEGGSAALAYGFERLRTPEIIAQCVVDNRESEAVMKRIGMRYRGAFDHPKVSPDTHPQLVRHSLYALSRDRWLEGRQSIGTTTKRTSPERSARRMSALRRPSVRN